MKKNTTPNVPRPALTVDIALFSVVEKELCVLLLRRTAAPFNNQLAFPGGFVDTTESLLEAAQRVLREKCSLAGVLVDQLHAFGSPHRDPRMRVVSVAHFGLVSQERIGLSKGCELVAVAHLKNSDLAFDHSEILKVAISRLRERARTLNLGSQYFEQPFPLMAVHRLHVAVLNKPINKDSFRRKLLAANIVRSTGGRQDAVGHRPAVLYQFNEKTAL